MKVMTHPGCIIIFNRIYIMLTSIYVGTENRVAQ